MPPKLVTWWRWRPYPLGLLARLFAESTWSEWHVGDSCPGVPAGERMTSVEMVTLPAGVLPDRRHRLCQMCMA